VHPQDLQALLEVPVQALLGGVRDAQQRYA
jgi:hypothetical protein